MHTFNRQTALRSLPAVHRLLHMNQTQIEFGDYPLAMVSHAFTEVLEGLRSLWQERDVTEAEWNLQSSISSIFAATRRVLEKRMASSLKPVLNLTGVVIHTNLGRAPLSTRAVAAVKAVAEGYSNLEFDLAIGTRGSRHDHVEKRLCRLTGAEAALVVNNNAAAVFLVLRELANGGEAVISRGQMVEIGGSFRVSEIMRESGVDIVEVGTTNKTRLSDYQQAIGQNTKLLMRVHTSNFRIVGFTEQPALSDLVNLARSNEIMLFEDLGSGSLYDLASRGIGDEPTVRASVDAGVDVISFSGDKLLGGAQAGIILGKKRYIERLKKNQLTRALRVDKMTLAALEATLIAHEDTHLAEREVPVIHMLTQSLEAVQARAKEFVQQLAGEIPPLLEVFSVSVQTAETRIGGGALPTESLPTAVVALTPRSGHSQPEYSSIISTQVLLDMMRTVPSVPIIARIDDDTVLMDFRTLLPGQESVLFASLREVAQAFRSSAI